MAQKKKKVYLAHKVLHDAFPTKRGATAHARSLKLWRLTDRCPHGIGAVVQKLTPAQDGGRLRYGVYVNRTCKVI